MSKKKKAKPVATRRSNDAMLALNLSRLETQIGDVQRAVHIAMLMVADEQYRFRLGLFAVEEAHKLADKLWTSFQDAHKAAAAGKEWDDAP
jgi:hypothetical protein